ncbi:hypothetical protein Tco_0743298 [Tanacetum coccineum]
MAALKYKDDHNKIAYLGRERGCEDFTDILGYLDHSPLRYALTHAPPVVFNSLVKQFWATAVVRPNAAGSHDLVATIDGHEVVVTESLIRAQLQFDDANGIFDMPINDILEGMRVIGYPTDGTVTFLKNHLSPQWRFLVHTLMNCLSPKSGSWNQFPSSIATALICLSTGRVYNFSRFILEGMIGNIKATKHKFLMYPRFLQMIVALETADRTPRPTFDFTRKIFANMKFKWEGQPIPLTTPMLAIAAAGNDAAGGDDAANEDNAAANEAAGSSAEAHLVPHSPPVSPVREPTPERQPVSERPPSPSPTIPETEWVVPNPVSPVTDWRPWPYVPVHSPIRDPTPEPVSPPTPPAEKPLVFGPEPRPAGPDNYLEPEDLDNIISGLMMPIPTADAAGRAEDPALLTRKAPMPDLEIPAELLARGCTGRGNASKKNRQVLGFGSAVTRLRIGHSRRASSDVNEDNFIERYVLPIRNGKKRALAIYAIRALPSSYRNYTMKAVKLMSKQQPPSKRQRVERASSQPSTVPAATTQPADDHDSAGGSSFHPAAAMDSAGSHHASGVSPFAASDDSSSPSPVSTDHIPIDVLFEPTSGDKPVEDFFSSESESDDDIEDYIPSIPKIDGTKNFLSPEKSSTSVYREDHLHFTPIILDVCGRFLDEHKMNVCEQLEVVSTGALLTVPTLHTVGMLFVAGNDIQTVPSRLTRNL